MYIIHNNYSGKGRASNAKWFERSPADKYVIIWWNYYINRFYVIHELKLLAFLRLFLDPWNYRYLNYYNIHPVEVWDHSGETESEFVVL